MANFEQVIVNQLCKLFDEVKQIRELSRASEDRTIDVYYITIPEEGGFREFAKGITKIDFKTGVIINPDSSMEELSRKLDSVQDKNDLHSISIQSDKDIKFRLNSSGQHSIGASFLFQLPYVTYRELEIECTEDSEVNIFACTNPQATLGNLNIISNISKSEKISITETDKDVHFTSSIAQYAQETENLNDSIDNKVYIRGINAQSIQKLKYRLIFWTKDVFSDTDLDADSYIDDVILDFTDDESVFRIDNANQYYLNISELGILYEDKDKTNEIHCSLQNLSAESKKAGADGGIQIDIKYAPRL